MIEIGSEYWLTPQGKSKDLNFFLLGTDCKFLMSGRTAIDFVLKDLEEKIDNKKVYLPNYICNSIIQPFIDNNYELCFYNVDLISKRFDIDVNKECGIFYAMNYFGYKDFNMDNYINEFSKKNTIIIEDITHRLLCEKNFCTYSDYLICSLRKWFPIISGGLAVNVKNKFTAKYKLIENDNNFLNMKKEAMVQKKEYIERKINQKDIYLKLFKDSNRMFEDYALKDIDEYSMNFLKKIDIDEIKNTRKRNVMIIEQLIKKSNKIKPICLMKDEDIPIFVPIFIENRDSVIKKLYNESIYCPIHWPKNDYAYNNIIENEISLICDQRYNIKDIRKYIELLLKFLEEK